MTAAEPAPASSTWALGSALALSTAQPCAAGWEAWRVPASGAAGPEARSAGHRQGWHCNNLVPPCERTQEADDAGVATLQKDSALDRRTCGRISLKEKEEELIYKTFLYSVQGGQFDGRKPLSPTSRVEGCNYH